MRLKIPWPGTVSAAETNTNKHILQKSITKSNVGTIFLQLLHALLRSAPPNHVRGCDFLGFVLSVRWKLEISTSTLPRGHPNRSG
eukprot:7338454-Prymnesium_polylepis.1